MNHSYSTPVPQHAPPHQHPLAPEIAGQPSHYHHAPATAHEQHPHPLPAAVPHAPYYPPARAPAMSAAAHPALPGIRDHAPDTGARQNATATLKGEQDNDGPPSGPAPPSVEKEDQTRKYKLVCLQQPQRARMCGFGDKDRRPITPPPCIRLVITDKATGMEVDCNQIEHQMYVLSVDLWNAEGTKEYNLVKHSTNSPSISSTTNASFRDLADGSGNSQYGQQQYPVMPPHERGPYAAAPPPPGMAYQQQMPGYGSEYSQSPYGYGAPPVAQYQQHSYPFRPDLPQNVPSLPSTGFGNRAYPQDMAAGGQRLSQITTQPANGMYTRNLIGSLVSSAARLTDPDDKIGIWFVLQDLSVRTEGWFRLRFSFVSVGVPNTQGDGQTSDPQCVNTAKAPILAQCFSEPFQVYSAKKFPGVCESTPLSKCFALQGIKIPIRKEGQEGKGSKNNKSDDEEDY
ncbi:velvet factor-domain-containing protein [Xylariales sp. AK1849]|nr:velvet factor-domain-containing protein [Xylariales sp. AK1849]